MNEAGDPADDLLLERERRAVRLSAIGRTIFVGIVSVVIVVAAGRWSEVVAMLAVCVASLVVQGYILRAVRDPARGVRAGLAGACADAVVLCLLPAIWHFIYTEDVEPLVHLSRHNYTAVSLALVALNGLALRPLYPALLGSVAVVVHVVVACLGLFDWRLEAFDGGLARALGVGMSATDLLVVTPFFVGLASVLIVVATRIARSTVSEAVAREQREHQLEQRQLQAVLDAKMRAVGDLVAGVEHEINNPLGALRSATDTAERAIGKIREAPGADAQSDRALAALEHSLDLTQQASRRINDVMTTIRGFVQLDRAELQRVDLATLVQDVMAVHRAAFRDDTQVDVELDPGVWVEGNAQRLTEALSTVIRNAGESFDEAGRLTVAAHAAGRVARVSVSDTGRGMSPEQVAGLFDVDFAAGERVHARFGMPLCRNIVAAHGGRIDVESRRGCGTTVGIELPLAAGSVDRPA